MTAVPMVTLTHQVFGLLCGFWFWYFAYMSNHFSPIPANGVQLQNFIDGNIKYCENKIYFWCQSCNINNEEKESISSQNVTLKISASWSKILTFMLWYLCYILLQSLGEIKRREVELGSHREVDNPLLRSFLNSCFLDICLCDFALHSS